jgi:RNA polymerase sigma-70 factor (ECF subfamily)
MRMAVSEEEAFVEFAKIFGPRLRAFFINRGLSVTDAEDLSVTCVTDISLKVDKYTPVKEGGFAAWVFTLARHAMIDWLRRRRATEPLPETLATPDQFNDDEDEPNMEAILAVRDALSQLSEDDRTLILLRDLGEKSSYTEIGERLGLRTDAIRVRHHRALKKLKGLLEKDPQIIKLLNRENNRGAQKTI